VAIHNLTVISVMVTGGSRPKGPTRRWTASFRT